MSEAGGGLAKQLAHQKQHSVYCHQTVFIYIGLHHDVVYLQVTFARARLTFAELLSKYIFIKVVRNTGEINHLKYFSNTQKKWLEII